MSVDRRPWLVIDADAAIAAAQHDAFTRIADAWRLCAPRLLWAETSSVLHRAAARRAASYDGDERRMFERIIAAPIELADDYDRGEPWSIASLLGWPKTYDAEYLAAARHRSAAVFSMDRQMRSGAERLGVVLVTPG